MGGIERLSCRRVRLLPAPTSLQLLCYQRPRDRQTGVMYAYSRSLRPTVIAADAAADDDDDEEEDEDARRNDAN